MFEAEYNRHGYAVLRNGREVYRAGNHPLDSTANIDPRYGLTLETIEEFAVKTGKEMAEEAGDRFGGAQLVDDES